MKFDVILTKKAVNIFKKHKTYQSKLWRGEENIGKWIPRRQTLDTLYLDAFFPLLHVSIYKTKWQDNKNISQMSNELIFFFCNVENDVFWNVTVIFGWCENIRIIFNYLYGIDARRHLRHFVDVSVEFNKFGTFCFLKR